MQAVQKGSSVSATAAAGGMGAHFACLLPMLCRTNASAVSAFEGIRRLLNCVKAGMGRDGTNGT